MSVLLARGAFLETDVASAATCDIGATSTWKVRITGVAAITSFGSSKKRTRIGRFAGALTLTNGANLVVPGGTLTTAAGDRFWAESDTSTPPIWRIISYLRADGKALTPPASGEITGLAAIATTGSASDLGVGTVPDARISGNYTNFGNVTLSGNIITSAATALISPNTIDSSDNKVLQLAGGGAFGTAGNRGSVIQLSGNENAGAGAWFIQAGVNAVTNYMIGGNGTGTNIRIYNGTADANDIGTLFLSGGGDINSSTRGAYLTLYGNEAGGGLAGRFTLSAGGTSTLTSIIGGAAANTSLRIGNATSVSGDSGDLQLYAGGNNLDTTRGAYLALYGNNHSTLAGRVSLIAGDAATTLSIIGGGTTAPVISIRNNSADTADGGAITLAAGGAATDVSRGAYLNLYGNENGQTGNILMAAGSAGGQIKLITSTLVLAAPTTTRAPLNFLTGSAPTSPVDGDMWREDNTNTGLKIRVNGVTKTVSLV